MSLYIISSCCLPNPLVLPLDRLSAEDPAEGEHAEGEASALETAETAAGATKPAAKATTQQVVDEEEVAQEGRESAVGDGDQGAANDQANEGENDPEQRHDAEEEGAFGIRNRKAAVFS